MKKLIILLMLIISVPAFSQNPFAPDKTVRKKCKRNKKASKKHLRKTYPWAGCYKSERRKK